MSWDVMSTIHHTRICGFSLTLWSYKSIFGKLPEWIFLMAHFALNIFYIEGPLGDGKSPHRKTWPSQCQSNNNLVGYTPDHTRFRVTRKRHNLVAALPQHSINFYWVLCLRQPYTNMFAYNFLELYIVTIDFIGRSWDHIESVRTLTERF